MSSRNLRIALSVVSVAMISLGIAFALFPSKKVTAREVHANTPECTNNVATALAIGQSISRVCAVSKDFWLEMSLASKAPITVSISLKTVGNTSALLYAATGTKFSGALPMVTSGSLTIQVRNSGVTGNSLSGYVTVFADRLETIPFTQVYFPLRLHGLVLIGAFGASLFVLVWNPWKIATTLLKRISGPPTRLYLGGRPQVTAEHLQPAREPRSFPWLLDLLPEGQQLASRASDII